MPTAIESLSRPIVDRITGGTLAPNELDVVREDLDLDKIWLDVEKTKKRHDVNIRSSVTDASVELSIEGAHQLTFVLHDPGRQLWRSGALDYSVSINIRDWKWRLQRVAKSGDDITLTFEPIVVAWLRQHRGRRKVRRGKTTRAEFIRALVLSVKKGNVKFKASELHAQQPVTKPDRDKPRRDERKRREERKSGLDYDYRIPSGSSGGKLSAQQTNVAERVLNVGDDMGARRKVLVMSMMAVYQESMFKTSATNGVHVGLFQQNKAMGWPATRSPEADSKAFFRGLIAADKQNPNGAPATVIDSVQRSGAPQAYAGWRNEAEDIVNHYMGSSGDRTKSITIKKPYEFRVKRRENYYGAAVRLAEEVRWRLWTVKDTFHLHAEDDLFKSKAVLTIREGEGGVDWIDYDADKRRNAETVTVTCRMRMWPAPIGTVVVVDDDGGPADGRYLVVGMMRSFFSQEGTITLRKPVRSLPEPPNETVTKTFGVGKGGAGDMLVAQTPGWPIPKGTRGSLHDTSGLPGFPAYDYFAAAGTPCISPVEGVITQNSGRDPRAGAYAGAGGPLGWSTYIFGNGRTYFLTHLGKRYVRVGQLVRRGEIIGAVANYHSHGRQDHIHMGVHVGRFP